MIYLILFSYIIIYLYVVRLRESKLLPFTIYFTPVGILLVLIYSLQDNVGTDYYSYLGWAEGTIWSGSLKNEGEMLFYNLVTFTRMFNTPQLIFFFTALIQVFFLMLITFEVKKMNFKLYIFFFLYFTLSLIFFNQFNGIRQYIAVNIIIYALLKLINDKKNIYYVLLVFLASLFHKSALFFLVFIIIKRFIGKKINPVKVITGLSLLLFLSFFDYTEYYNRLLTFLPIYSNFIDSGYLQRMSFEGIITKLPKLIIVIYAALSIDKAFIGDKERILINLSYISCGLMIMSFNSGILWRFYQYLDFFILFPVLLYMHEKRNKRIAMLISTTLIVILIIKIIIIPRGEYLYDSILF